MAAKSSSLNSGVGGYRPTIDWHEITIKQKSVADKQVLMCIVVTGLLMIVLGIILAVLGLFVMKGQCPLEWLEGPGSCYYFAAHNATWTDSAGYCESQGAKLLDIHTQPEADFVKDRLLGPSWLGLYRDKGEQEWRWSSGAKVNYTAFTDTIPSSGASRQCAVVQETGSWEAVGCGGEEESAYVICDYQPGYNPFVLIGPVVIFCGVVVLMLSIEVCVRRREFLGKNPEVMDDDDDDDSHEVDPGLVNYGYGNFPTETASPIPSKNVSWAPVDASSPNRSSSKFPGGSSLVVQPQVETTAAYSPGSTGAGPRVHVVPASMPNSPNLASENLENTQSQEQLELLLSPKTLE